MVEFFYLGKHTIFVYIAYIFSLVILLLCYIQPHLKLKKKILKRKNENNSDQ